MSETEQSSGTRELTPDASAGEPVIRGHRTATAREEQAPASTGAFADGAQRERAVEHERGHDDHDDHDDHDEDAGLLAAEDDAGYKRRWEEIQTGFVDEPRRTVEQADELVAQVMQRLAEGFASERERLEAEWGRGEDVSTEDLRVALQRYRRFFRRMLSA